MANKDFFIYSDRNKLLTPSNAEYRVQTVLKSKELKSAIKACKEDLDLDGAHAVFKNFDKLFSVIELIDQLDYPNLHFVYDEILVKSLNIIESFFLSFGNVDDIPPDLKHEYTNIIKMTVYLFVEFVNSFNSKIETDYKLLLLETKGRNKKQDMVLKHASDYDWNWEDKLSGGFNAINNIILNDITQLYDPPYIDHTFVSYVASCCYTQLENPSIAFVRTKQLCESIMQILIIFITKYDHANDFKTKVIQLLRLYEHLSLPLAKTVLQIVESESKCASLIELIVKEIAQTGEMESLRETSSQEVTGGKSCCTFLVEIAKQCPQFVLPNIDHLLPCLDCDPYSMRICVLSVLKELIIHVLNNDQLNKIEQRTRDDYLNIIQDHTLDVNAFVRSKALQLLTSIISEDCLPKQMYKVVLNCAEDKLHDKSSYVTKSAIQLIKTLIKLNPYSCDFSEKSIQSNLNEEKNDLKNMEQALEIKTNGETNKEEMWLSIESPLKSFLDETFEDNSLEFYGKPKILKNIEISQVIMKIKKCITLQKFDLAIKFILIGNETFKDESLFNFKIQDENDFAEDFFLLLKKIWFYDYSVTSIVQNDIEKYEQMTAEELSKNICSTESKIEYLEECVQYLDTIKTSLNTISQLMFGNTTSESLEAIDFFTTAHLFGVPHAQTGIDAMLTLIYSSDTNIKEAMMNSYKKIYLVVEDNKDNTDSTSRPVTIMIRLINLVKTLNVTYRKAFKVLLCEWIKNKVLDDDCVMVLWAWFTKSMKISHENRVAATLLLSLIASANPSIVKGNLDNLIKYGLSEEYEVFIYTCQVFEQMAKEDFKRFSVKHEMTSRVTCIIQNCFNKSDVQMFNDVALNAVNIIYKLTSKPDETCMLLIKKLYASMEKNKKNSTDKKKEKIELDVDLVAKFIFLVGHIALQQYYHLENYVSKELIRKVRNKYQSKKSKTDSSSGIDNMHDSEAAEIEMINEEIRLVCDNQLVNGNGILSIFSTLILEACTSNHKDLKTNAVIALMKYMLVSTTFCQKHLPVFLNLIENSDNIEMSIDLVSGFGWLIFRHPNVLEPVTNKLYARLKDKCNEVRFSTLLTIIDLIRQEMVKVRGQIAGIARLLVDEDEKIKYTAKKLFEVISVKGNTLYNVISDIISILSNPEDLVPENDFQTIMKFLLPLITKERQIESLVDKLCIRLKESVNDVQAYYISYCLMIIKYTDKSLTKLSDNINFYTDKLKYPKVYNNFNSLINSNSRMVKPATKDILTELISKIEKIVKDEGFYMAALSQKTPGKRLTTTKKKPPKSTIKEFPEIEMEPLQVVTKRSTRSTRSKVKRKLLVVDSEEEENIEDLALSRSVSNNSKSVYNKDNANSKTDDETVGVLKQSTRRNVSERTRKKKSRHVS